MGFRVLLSSVVIVINQSIKLLSEALARACPNSGFKRHTHQKAWRFTIIGCVIMPSPWQPTSEFSLLSVRVPPLSRLPFQKSNQIPQIISTNIIVINIYRVKSGLDARALV